MEIRPLDVDEELIERIWNKVKDSGSFYSIGDGVTREHFKKVFFESNLVIAIEGGIARFELNDNFVEIHVLVFGHSFFRNAAETLRAIYAFAQKSFQNKPIRCMIPNEMRGFKRLAQIAGMAEIGLCSRNLTGVLITCMVYEWRPDNVQ
jgi:hypothetical protein